MSDLAIIKRIGKELDVKIENRIKVKSAQDYLLDKKGHVISLNLSGSSIGDLSRISEDLEQLTELRELTIDLARLHSIEPLKNLVKLEKISIANNEIRIISCLQNMKQLTQIVATDNEIKDISALRDLKNLVHLELDDNNIEDISPLQDLTLLTHLDLNINRIKNITPLKSLHSLETLFLGKNKIANLSPLSSLVNLEQVDLQENMISNIIPLKDLINIFDLNLSSNLIENLDGIQDLEILFFLDVRNNHISTISDLDEVLPCLDYLDISDNKIADITPLKEAIQLKRLHLSLNPVNDISVIGALEQLEELHINNTKCRDFTPISNLVLLTHLEIEENSISNISFLENCLRLQKLSLRFNDIYEISALQQHKELISLDLRNNPLTTLPAWITDLKMEIFWTDASPSEGLLLQNNPLQFPPPEIIMEGKEAITRYFQKIREEGIDYIYEAKLTLVGEGSAGKSSLQTRLLDEKAPLPLEDKRTRGIKIYDWKIGAEKGRNQTVHIWDFGGQDVYYPVHRFFLTENSVFVLLASTRHPHHNFDYWIPTIFQFGGKSPIILAQTCHDGNKVTWNDISYFIGNPDFNIIKTQEPAYFQLNLPNKNEGLKSIRHTVTEQIKNLPHFGKGVASSWVQARHAIATKHATASCIPFEKFKEICRETNPGSFTKVIDIEDFARFLHSIGVILWYSQEDGLRDWVVLQPEWAMNAVYKIIDDDEIQNRAGHILKEDFERLWNEDCHEGRLDTLKKMLEVFKIAFPKKHKKGEYIIPARLLSIPVDERWPDTEPYLRLEYKFDFMPKGLVNQLSANLSRYISSESNVWNNAVNFSNPENTAHSQVEEDFYNRKIKLRSKGVDARDMNTRIMDAMKDITDEYKGVTPDIYIPCSCEKCEKNLKPTTFLLADLYRWYTNKENAKVTCNESDFTVTVESLLYNAGLPKPVKEEKEKPTKVIKIFLASSAELKDEREKIELFINRENKMLVKRRIFLELNIWEDFIDAMSQTRLQDEYNRSVAEADIFISLFFTKVGKYTAEEFEIAYNHFKQHQKPLIYTFFKDGEVNINQMREEDIVSKFSFDKKLKSLGHFPTMYKSPEDLQRQLKLQFEKILPDI